MKWLAVLSLLALSGRSTSIQIDGSVKRTRSSCNDFCKRDEELQRTTSRSRHGLCKYLCRRRRSAVEPQGCRYGDEEGQPKSVKGLRVKFNGERREANVSWNKAPDKNDSWDAYCILWTSGTSDEHLFPASHKIPKEQQYYIIRENRTYWSYPDNLWLTVLPQPISDAGVYEMQEFNPRAPPASYSPPRPPTKDPPKVFGSIIGGCVGGLALLGVIFIFCRKYRSRSSPERSRDVSNEVNFMNRLDDREFFFASYYPESAKHIVFVASIVNWFREKGYAMIMDKMASNEVCSNGPMRWAERQIKKAKKVVVFMSPGYVRLCEDEEVARFASDDVKRVWYEMRLLRNIYCNSHSAARIVCVLLGQELDPESMPPWAEVRYRWPEDREDIMKRLNDSVNIDPSEVAARLQPHVNA